jgi:hypothetical protein
VDAIDPARLRRLVRDCIERHVDREQLARTKRAEELKRKTLRTFVSNLPR